MDVKNIRISDFDYPLPDEIIARHPLARRDSCRLLVAGAGMSPRHEIFSSLPDFIPEGSLMVCNEARVINARLTFEKATGSKIEIFLLDPYSPRDYVLMFQSVGRCEWKCLVGNLKRWKSGALVKKINSGGREIELKAWLKGEADGNSRIVEFEWDAPDVTFASVVDAAGYIPIPPYLKRKSEESDSDDYQTVYSRVKGSVAAPTAGLHFTPEVFDNLKKHGVDVERLTLHVGAGTFQPVKSETIGDHPMHTEVISVDLTMLERLREALGEGRKIVAVGTTTVRTLESLPYLGQALKNGIEDLKVGQWWPYGEAPWGTDNDFDTLESLDFLIDWMASRGMASLTASTAIMIAPGFRWRIVDMMVTNFHQPESTLLLLVSSFLERNALDNERAGKARWRDIYDEALKRGYRFLSYGDACLFC